LFTVRRLYNRGLPFSSDFVSAMFALGSPQRREWPPAETQTVAYQKAKHPEGGTTVVEVNVVKGTAVPKEAMMSPTAPKEESKSPDLVV
jgi:hypothetical protein